MHRWRRHECASGARVATERRIKLPPAIRVRREEGVQYGRGVELGADREMEVIKQRVKRERGRPLIHVI